MKGEAIKHSELGQRKKSTLINKGVYALPYVFNTSFRWGWPLSAIKLKASHSAFESENSGDRGRVEISVVYGCWLTSIPKVKERKKGIIRKLAGLTSC